MAGRSRAPSVTPVVQNDPDAKSADPHAVPSVLVTNPGLGTKRTPAEDFSGFLPPQRYKRGGAVKNYCAGGKVISSKNM